jgi:L-2-hydroxyglutarate oxidase LhgO
MLKRVGNIFMNEGPVNLRIQHVVPDDVPRFYPTSMVVQHNQHEFDIYFFDIKDPILTGTPEENQKILQNLEAVEARCIARITINATRMPEFLQVLDKNFEKFLSKFVVELPSDENID